MKRKHSLEVSVNTPDRRSFIYLIRSTVIPRIGEEIWIEPDGEDSPFGDTYDGYDVIVTHIMHTFDEDHNIYIYTRMEKQK